MSPSDFKPKITSVLDDTNQLRLDMRVLTETDGGIYAVLAQLHNTSAERDVVVRVNEELSASFMLTVTDAEGKPLTKPPRRFNTEERQSFTQDLVRQGEFREWLLPIRDRLEDPEGLQDTDARVVLGVYCSIAPADPDGAVLQTEFVHASLTTYDTAVRLTRMALAADPAKKYAELKRKNQ